MLNIFLSLKFKPRNMYCHINCNFRFKSEMTWQWMRQTAYLCVPMIRCRKKVWEAISRQTWAPNQSTITISGFNFPLVPIGFLCLWSNCKWPSTRQWLQWNWDFPGRSNHDWSNFCLIWKKHILTFQQIQQGQIIKKKCNKNPGRLNDERGGPALSPAANEVYWILS